jgi:hypothetical protein
MAHFPPARSTGSCGEGRARAAWRVQADVALLRGSRLSGVAYRGAARGNVTREGIREAAIDLSAARRSSPGPAVIVDAADRATIALDAPNLAELAPLLLEGVGASDRRRTLREGDARGRPPRGGIELDATARSSSCRAAWRSARSPSMRAWRQLPAGSTEDFRRDLATRRVELEVTARASLRRKDRSRRSAPA